MTTRAPTAILPRDLGSVPPPLALVGRKAHGLAQLLAVKARVPRFAILTAEAFEAHIEQDEIARALHDAHDRGFPDDAARTATGEALVRALLRTPLPVAIRIAISEIVDTFAAEDLLAVRASVVGEAVDAAAVAGALDSALGLRGKEAVEDAVQKVLSLAFHVRTLTLRHQAGLDPLGTRLAIVVQRMILSEASGVCSSQDLGPGDTSDRAPRVALRSTWGLAGGIGGKTGSPRIPCDTFLVERPQLAADGVDDAARVTQGSVENKGEALRFDEGMLKGVRMVAIPDHLKKEPSLSIVQARMVAREAVRLEAAFGKPQVMSFAFAGRLLHVTDIEPLLVPVARVESARTRTWDDRLIPAGLPEKVAPLTFSVWQRAAARGVERAGRILGVKGVLLEEVRPQMPRVIGLVSGRVYGNLEVLTALVDLLPFSDKMRPALADATGQQELIPRKAPPPGFWQRQRQKLDEGRWLGQLEKIAETTTEAGAHLRTEAATTLRRAQSLALDSLDPDTLLDVFDELEDALSKIVAALAMSGMTAMLERRELQASLDETDLARHPGVVMDLLSGDVPNELLEATRRVFSLAAQARKRALISALLREHCGREDSLAQKIGLHAAPDGTHAGIDHDDVRWLCAEVKAIAYSSANACVSDFALETPRLHERPEHVLFALTRLVDTDVSPELLELRVREAEGKRKKAEYAAEAAFTALGGLRVASVKKRTLLALEELRKHGREAALGWILAEQIVASLRMCTLGVGERLFEHGLVDQPRDVLQLEVSELAGIVRGTGIDSDVKPLVAARKRAAVARPAGLPRRVETRGVVATSLLSGEDDDEAQISTPPTEAHEIQGRGASAGDVRDTAVLLDPALLGAARPSQARGIVVVRSPTLRDLPLLAASRAVVAERGTVYGPAAFALRALGVPLVVDAAQATSTLADGVHLHVDANTGVVRRAGVEQDDIPARVVVDPHVFAREAVVSDPRMRVRPSHPAQAFDELPPPPLVRPATTMDEFVAPPSGRSAMGRAESAREPSSRSAVGPPASATGRPVEGPFDDAFARERPPQILGPAADPDAVGRFGGRGRAALAGFGKGTPSEEKSVDDGDIVQSTDLESTEIYDHDPRNPPKRK